MPFLRHGMGGMPQQATYTGSPSPSSSHGAAEHGVSDQWIKDRIASGAAKLRGSARSRADDMGSTANEHMIRAKAISRGALRQDGVEGDHGPLSEHHHSAMRKRGVAAKASLAAAAKISGGKKHGAAEHGASEHGVSADWIRNKVASGASKLKGQEALDRLHKFATKMTNKNNGAQYGKNSAQMGGKYLTATFAGHKALGEKIAANGPIKSYRDMGVTHEEMAESRAKDEASRAKFNALPASPRAKATPAPKAAPAAVAKASPAPKAAPAPTPAPAPAAAKAAPRKRATKAKAAPAAYSSGGGSSAITGGTRIVLR